MIKILLFLKKEASPIYGWCGDVLKDLHPIKIEILFQQLKNNAREFPKNRRIRSNDRIIAATTFHFVQNTRSIHQSRQARVPNPPIDQTTVRRQVEICEKTPCFARAGLEEESTEAFPVHLIDAGCSTMREKKKRGGHAAATRLKVDPSEAIVRRPFTPFPFHRPSKSRQYRAEPTCLDKLSTSVFPRWTVSIRGGEILSFVAAAHLGQRQGTCLTADR